MVQNGPIQAPEDPETREIVERTAALVGTHGLLMERRLLAVNVNDERYDFLRSREDHPYYDFYRRKVVEHELTPDDEPSGDLLLFTCPPQGITRKEFGALKLTAQFVARYGMSFWRDLIHCVTMNPNPLFEFVKTSDINFSLLLRLVDAYEMALEPYKKSCLHRTNPKETVLEGEKHSEEVGVQLATIDLHAFVSGLDFIASREVGQLSYHLLFNWLTNVYVGVMPAPGRLRLSPAAREIILDGFFYLLEDGSDIATSDLHAFVGGIDYFAKRENYEKSALLPQHPSYTFR
ncbi:hypothetical protein Bca52824_078762 [Brassica carinata]|uniref:SURP motif domain-containing protein n=1 Tax=Brassica carinata TaxID=52824 RepID=A0A8X7PY88_BRACI|nr:hypothetical protein Bca52824_078762 [Brassica carinata]